MGREGRRVVVVGGGGHARVLLDILRLRGEDVLGYTDVASRSLPGAAYLGSDAILEEMERDRTVLVNGLGAVDVPRRRRGIFERLRGRGFRFLTLVHPAAVVAEDALIEEGAQVMAGAVVNPGARVGADAIVNTRAGIDHDVEVGAHTHVAPGATICGGVRIGECCLIGSGAVVVQGCRIGGEAFVKAGALVCRDVAAGETTYGRRSRVRPWEEEAS